MSAHDVVVLGGGPGGYAAALYGASTGLNVAMIEEQQVGGTCLHRGCIPAKALLHAAEVVRTVGEAERSGSSRVRLLPGLAEEQRRKAGIVDQLYRGPSGLLRKRKVTMVNGHGGHRRRRGRGQRDPVHRPRGDHRDRLGPPLVAWLRL